MNVDLRKEEFAMKVQWCWRCKKDVSMFDEEEYAILDRLYTEGLEASKQYMQWHDVPANKIPFSESFCALIDMHAKMTGIRDMNHDEIRKHRIIDYGPPCPSCGKVLRTPEAKKCYECGCDVT
jgi:hypothetical protein